MQKICSQNLTRMMVLCWITVTAPASFAQQVTTPPRPAAPMAAQDQTPDIQTPGFGPAHEPSISGRHIIGQSYDGIDYLNANCFCSPPDSNAAVGRNFVVETVNTHIRIFDKATGTVMADQPLNAIFNAFSGGDPYVLYDDTADRWYVSAFDSNDQGLFLAVSKDGNPVDGFLPPYHLTNVGTFPDYQKAGFNHDAIFISYNDFSAGAGVAIASIDKAAALAGTLTYFVSHPAFQFRAMPPAQMHNDRMHDDRMHDGYRQDNTDTNGRDEHHHKQDGAEWFVSTEGSDSGGSTIRVTRMTGYLSDTPNFTYTSLPVTQYRNAGQADQPGGIVTTFPNTTTTQVQYHNGRLTTAMASAAAADGFVYPKGRLYQIDVSQDTPTLLRETLIDPGDGVALQMPSVEEDNRGNLGFTWIEISSTEYLSMWIGVLYPNGRMVRTVAAPGGGFFFSSSRIGDYSTTVLDPSDNQTFWSANEYIGDDGFSDIWRTHITSFSAQSKYLTWNKE